MGRSQAMSLSRISWAIGSAFRESGLALDRLGCQMMGSQVQNYEFCRSRPMMNIFDKGPTADNSAFLAPTAEVIGDVSIGAGASIWPDCVVRGDTGAVKVGAGTNIRIAQSLVAATSRWVTT